MAETSGGSGAERPAVRIGDIHGSSFSIGGTHNTNSTVHHGGTGDRAPGAEELLEAVRELRAALVRLPRSPERAALDGELDEVAGELEAGGEVRAGLPARLRAALERWAPLVDSVSAATALAALLTSLGG
ncbi:MULTISPECIES: hypothetical protein [unclassified Streptomyces]|uniref:hypothetical protein n=1 Tax=unclassified Streptomyces TaxID=2593676 RepID=UPI00214CD473|nr:MULTISPECIES: hypothetical protein [unclassified Streptomyces]MCX5606157.1 hypothetical protein [Streptomyces sp. NBC_00047]UUU40408.1 hypothetical protein JIW86_17285 [Streptomyces sp. NBC_00162]